MRCKKGDLAFIKLPAEDFGASFLNGKVVTCEKITHHRNGRIMWLVTPQYRIPMGRLEAVADECLVPIRPGDEPDETLAWAPVPAKKELVEA